MTVRVYYSTDASAPVLTGLNGSLISVIDGCLVNGYTGKASLGWTKAFTGTNLAAYRAGTGQGNRRFLRVIDNLGQWARIIGYENMTSVSAGTGLFPTSAQFNGGLYVAKSSSADNIPRPWILVATERLFYLMVWHSDEALYGPNNCSGSFFGDFTSYKSGDTFNTLIVGGNDAGSPQVVGRLAESAGNPTGTSNGHFITRSHTQTGTSIFAGVISSGDRTNGGIGSPGFTLPFPNPVTGAFDLAPILVTQPLAQVVRGLLPGIWNPLHSQTTLQSGDTVDGTGDLAGKSFLLLKFSNNSMPVFEISNTW